MSDDVPVICRLDVEQLHGYGAACLFAAEMVEQFADRLRGGVTSLEAAIIGLEQLQQRLDEQAQIATAMIANTEAEDTDQAPVADAEARPPAKRAAAAAPQAEAELRISPIYTPDRMEKLAELWPQQIPRAEILAQLNAMPGMPIASVDALKQQAKKANLVGPQRAAQQAMLAAPPASTPAGSAMEPLSTEEELEARQMLASGEHGAQSLAEYFGGPLTWWQDWCAQQRAAS